MENRVLKVKKDLELSGGINFKKGTEIEIINSNEKSFEDVTRSW